MKELFSYVFSSSDNRGFTVVDIDMEHLKILRKYENARVINNKKEISVIEQLPNDERKVQITVRRILGTYLHRGYF